MTVTAELLCQATAPLPVLIDTHAHLDFPDFDSDRDEVLAQARAGGVACVVVPGVCHRYFDRLAACCAASAMLAPAFGVHPRWAGEGVDPASLAARLTASAAVAVGEIGLDGGPDAPQADVQRAAFADQLALARELALPVLLHVHRALDQVLWHLRRIRVVGGIAHAFSGSRQQAEQLLGLGFRLGLGGAMTHERARRLQQLARDLPLSAFVLETDAPDMAPAWARGIRNVPARLPAYAAWLARLRDIDIGEVANATTASACTVLRLPGFGSGGDGRED